MVKVGSLQHNILNSLNPINSIDVFFDRFLKLTDYAKVNLILFLSENQSIDEKFYPLFISKVYEQDKESLKFIKTNVIVQTHAHFNSFYFEFLNILCLSNYDFSLFKSDFEHIYFEDARTFFNETIEYIDLNKNIRDF